jgi:hypothetical protein
MSDLQGSRSEAWWRTPTGITTLVLAIATIVGSIITGVFGLIDDGPGGGSAPGPVTVPSTTSTTVSDTSTTSMSTTTGITTSTRGATKHYLVDLEYYIDTGATQAGVVTIAGKQYKKSFRDRPCLSDDILVKLPPGVSQVSGLVGFPDDSQDKEPDVLVRVESTTDQLDNNAEWVAITELTLSTRQGRAFSEVLPSGVQALRLSSDTDLCAGRIDWANPLVH